MLAFRRWSFTTSIVLLPLLCAALLSLSACSDDGEEESSRRAASHENRDDAASADEEADGQGEDTTDADASPAGQGIGADAGGVPARDDSGDPTSDDANGPAVDDAANDDAASDDAANDDAASDDAASDDSDDAASDDAATDDAATDDAADDAASDDAAGGGQTGADDSSQTDEGVPGDGAGEPGLWLFSVGDEGRAHNVLAPSQRVTAISAVGQASTDAKAWSLDGRKLARLVGERLEIFELGATAQLTPSIDVPGASSILRWVGGERLLLSGSDDVGPWLELVSVSGERVPLGQTLDDSVATYHSASPDGSALFYSGANFDGMGYSLYLVRPLEDAPAAELVNTYNPSPILSASWSADSRLFTFGISGPPDNGIYVWGNGMNADPARVSGAEEGYTPFHYFDAAGEYIAMQLMGSEGPALIVREFADPAGLPRLVAASPGVSPPAWSRTGSALTYSDDSGGWLYRADEPDAPSLELDGYAWSCPLAWLSDSEFVYAACAGNLAPVHARVTGSMVTTREVDARPATGLWLSDDGECLFSWDDRELRVIASPLEANPSAAVVALAGATLLRVAPDASGVAYADGNIVRWLPTPGCSVDAEPVLVDAHPGAVAELSFITSP